MLRTVENAREENVPTTTIVDCVTVCANASVAPTNSIVFSIFSTAHESDRNSRINSRTLRMTEYGKTVMKTEVSAQTKVGLAEVELQESLASTNNYSNSTANQFASLDRQCSSNIQASQVDDGWGGAHHGAPITVALAANYRCSIRSSSHHFSQHSSHHHFVLMTKKPLGYCCRQIPSTSHHHSACRSPLVSQTSNTAYGARRRDDDSDETNQTRIAVMRNVCSKQIATQCSFIASFKTNRQSNALSYRKNNNNNNNHNVVQYRRPSRSLSPILNSEHFAATNIADQFDQIRIGAEQRRRMQTNSSFVPIHSGTQYRGEPIPCNIRAKASPSRERRKTTQNREKQKKTLMLIKPECESNLCPHPQTQSASHWSLIYCKRLFHRFQSSLIQSLITFGQLLLLLFSTLLSSLHLQLFNLCPPYFNELQKSSSSASSTVASIFSCLEIGNNNKEKKTQRCLKQSFIRTSKTTKSLCFSQLNFVSFCFLLLLSNSGCLPAVSAQFPSDDVEAALEPPPSAQRSTPSTTANNNNNISAHHRRHPEQKQTEIGLNITKILNAFFDSGYDKRVRPNYAGPPVEVGVTMHIISISSISAVQMDFTSDFYFRQAWRDSRLSFTPRPGIEALFVGAEVSEKIWVPDTFFANEKSAQFHMATTPNTFIRIKANGEVFRSMRLTVTSSCPMNLQYFPMDRQSCTIEVESYGYSMADIQYHWGIDGKGSVNLANNLELPQFKVNKHRQMTKVEVLSTGNYSRLVCEIEFVRSMGYYLIQIYIPASLIVIISWVSFWLHRNASPARVQLGVTTVLTMTTLMSSTNAAMPKISYIKSIDVFLGTCFVMVFAALLEYATVGYMGKRIAMRKSRTQQIVRMLNEHRERCIAAAAAAAATQQNGKIGDDIRFGSGGSSSGSGGAQHPAMVRTASLYQDLDDGTLHKRELRSGSCYPQAATFGAVVPPATLHRSLERTASMKSRIYSDCDDPETTGMTNFNDDLSVFVSANTGTGASGGTVGGSIAGGPSGSHYATNGTGLGYHYQERNSEAWPHQHGRSATLNDRLYLPSNYVVKDHNTLFGVCPSDIDKYSRVVFPVCFLCFNLMYWIIYMHISEFLTDDQGLNSTQTTINDSGE